MARRPRVSKSARVQGAVRAPTPIHSATVTPCSSAFPSAYPSDDEFEAGDAAVKNIPIHRLTLQDFSAKKRGNQKSAGAPVPRDAVKPFPFLALPSELRVKVYDFHFADADPVVDLHYTSRKKLHALALLRTCKLVYHEATHHFFSTRAFRIFPIHPGRFIRTRRPLLARLRPHQRASMNKLELRLGPGFSKPPRGWVVSPALGLADCTGVAHLSVLVQLDPSAGFLTGLGIEEGAYEAFSRGLLRDILVEMPWVQTIELDAWIGVEKDCPIMRTLLEVIAEEGRQVVWGPLRGWNVENGDSPKTVPATAFMDGAAGVALLDF